MNYAIFCYREDYKCLELCVKQIRRADCNARIYLFDDGARPLRARADTRGEGCELQGDVFSPAWKFEWSGMCAGHPGLHAGYTGQRACGEDRCGYLAYG